MKKKYFGTDGIRGTFNQFPIVSSFFFDLTKAIKETHKNVEKILIGKDTRESSDLIELDIVSGFRDVGVESHSCGVVSTPILSFNTKKFNYDLGIMISASHNPYKDNGIKIFNKYGEKLNDSEELKIEKNLNITNLKIPPKYEQEKIENVNYLEYEDKLINRFSILKKFNTKILLDCAHGSLSKIAPNIFKRLEMNYISIGIKPNGKNINRNYGATYPLELSKRTMLHNAKIGISFDGDADRVIFCDEMGNVIDGDFILAILALFYKKKRKLINNLVVSTKMSNLGLRSFLLKNDIKYHLSDVGDRYVIEMMKKNNCILGGEQSGHIIFSENSFCGDGIFTALLVIQILKENNISLSSLCKNLFTKVPQELVNLKLFHDPLKVIKNVKIQNLLKSVSKINNCDVLLRKSGTEKLLRLMVQAQSKKLVKKILEHFLLEIKEIDER